MAHHLVHQLDKLKNTLLSLAAFAEEQVEKAVTAFSQRDVALAKEVTLADETLDQMEVDLEEECLKTLALHQPVAYDLRFVIAVLKINNDLERVGDLAANLAERCLSFSEHTLLEPPFEFLPMAEKAGAMLKKSIDALIQENTSLAREVIKADYEVNEMHRRNYQAIFRTLPTRPEDSAYYMLFLSASRYLERIGDLATNIAEDVIYLIEGEIVRHRKKSI